MRTLDPIRPAAVAGRFYPADARALRAEIDACLAGTAPRAATGPVKLLIVPHAGYVYSGPIAASAYALLVDRAAAIERVVLMGPAHRVPLRGIAMPTVRAFETPLGRVPLDRAALDALAALPQIVASDAAHAQEHSIEVQLPFMQRVLGDGFQLVPLAVGGIDAEAVAEVLERLWGGDETLIVISSDLSHYLPYAEARDIDRRTAARIGARASDLAPHEACGAHALNGALLAARRHQLRPRLLDLRNSGDTAGDRDQVVGYAAFIGVSDITDEAIDDTPDEVDAPIGDALLARARNAIGSRFALAVEPEPAHPALAEPGATFVTLRAADGRLRGCIGTLEAETSLDVDVRRRAVGAAFHDPRFAPLRAHEWPGLGIEVSLLGPSRTLPSMASAALAADALRAGIDGVSLEWLGGRATLLPQVWRELPDPADFVEALGRKAGLAPGAWHASVRLSRYSVRRFHGRVPEPEGASR